jgi:RNA polymerase sigma-70 factor (ECF subfamily)
VYESHASYVFRCLRSLGLHGPLLDDAVQDVFMVVQQKLAAFDGRHQLRTWLYAIVVRIARRYRSRFALDAARLVEHEPADPLLIDAELEQRQRLVLAQHALCALDPDKREVFVLAHVEEMSAPEIAQIIGLPVNTVYSRLRAARLAFAAEVERLMRGGNRSRQCP